MRRYFCLIVFCLSTFISVAQHLEKTAAKPPYNYIYAINKEQAWKINSYKYRAVYTKEFLSKPLDSLTLLDQIPDNYFKGGYVVLGSHDNYVETHFLRSDSIIFQTIKNASDLGLVVHNRINKPIKDIQFYTEKNKIELSYNGYYYVVPKALYGKALMVATNDEFYIIDIPDVKKTAKSKTGTPKESDGFLLTDKPKYHFGDTVFMKAYFSPTLFHKKAIATIDYSDYSNKSYKRVQIYEQKLSADKNGSYTNYVVLPDTLPVDQTYYIELCRGKNYLSTDFRIEDYKLDDIFVDAKVNFDRLYQDSLRMHIVCGNAQGDPLTSGWIYFNFRPQSIEFSELNDAFIPYVMLKDSIQITGQHRYTYTRKMPDLPYGEYSMELSVQVSTNGLVEKLEQNIHYSNSKVVMIDKVEKHVCEFTPYSKQVVLEKGLALYGSTSQYDSIPVSFPFRVDFQNEKLPTAFLVGQTMITVQQKEISKHKLDYTYTVKQDKIAIQVYNPFMLSVRVSNEDGAVVYHNDEELFVVDVPLKKNQRLYCEYILEGNYVNRILVVSPDYNALVIAAAIADTIRPGSTSTVNVHVSDIKGKARSNVNLTALAVDSRLYHEGVPNINTFFEYKYKTVEGKYLDLPIQPVIKDTALAHYVYNSYSDFLYSDSIHYFLVPEAIDTLTEAFMYVLDKDTYIRPGYVLEDGKPVYWGDVGSTSKQSFYTTPGYHTYEIRLPHKTIFIDSVLIYGAFKNNILIPIDRISSKEVHTESRPKRLTKAEVETLSAYLYTIKADRDYYFQTQTNAYSGFRKSQLVDSDPNLKAKIDSTGIRVEKTRLVVSKEKNSYLRRLRFDKLNANQSAISMAELKTLEVDVAQVNVRACTFKPGVVDVSQSYVFAVIYINEHFKGTVELQLIDTNRVSYTIPPNSYYNRYSKFECAAGPYMIRAVDVNGKIVKEQKINIDKRGYYIIDMYPDNCVETISKAKYTDLYSDRGVSYPNATMHYKPLYTYRHPYSRSRRGWDPYSYWGAFVGTTLMYTDVPKMSSGYQLGILLGRQIAKRMRLDLKLSYGEMASFSTQPYQYNFYKISTVAWHSVFNYKSSSNLYLGTGVSVLQKNNSIQNDASVSMPFGAAFMYRLRYTESVNLEVLWNKTLAGTDYSYLNKGVWEINVRVNFRFPSRGRVLCPSNFWGGEDDAVVRTPRYSYDSVDGKKATVTGLTYNEEGGFEVNDYAAPLEVNVRSNFYDRAYWIPSFKSDANGNALFTGNYPDALTHWDNYIIAYKGHKFNTWQVQNTAYLTNYIQVYVPRFAIRGDSLSATYHVKSDKPFVVQNIVNNKFVGKSFSPDGHYSLLAAGKDSIYCKSVLVVDSSVVDGEQQIIPIFNAGNETYTGVYAYVTGDTVMAVVKPDSAIETKIYFSKSIHDFVQLQCQQLMDYKYYCNEQIASKLIGALFNESKLRDNPKQLYAQLKDNANHEGLYGWWGYSETNVSMSAYVYYALGVYYKNKGVAPEPFYVKLGAKLIEYASLNTLDYYTYWMLRESGLNVDKQALTVRSQKTYQEEILHLRIRQLDGDSITRSEIESFTGQTILNNVVLNQTNAFQSDWYNDELLYLLVLHKISKAAYPDIAARIQRGLVEKGCLSEYAPTYVKALFVNEFSNPTTEDKIETVVMYDQAIVTKAPFTKTIQDQSNHILRVQNSSGSYFVRSDKQIRTTRMQQQGLEIDYGFMQEGKPITILKSGTMVDQVVSLKISKSCSYTMVEIPIAAGCMVEDVLISYPGLLSHREVFRDKIILYFDHIPAGTYTFTIREKVLFNGNYQLNPCSINLMYFPMIQTQTALRRIVIE